MGEGFCPPPRDPHHRIFERSCEIGLWRLTAHKISDIFGRRITTKLKGKLNTTLGQVEPGHRVFRAYWKHAFLKQYETFSNFLRNEVFSNNLADFGHNTQELNRGRSLAKFPDIVSKLKAILERFQQALSCMGQCFIADQTLEHLPASTQVG